VERTLLIEASVPAFPRGVKFRFNNAKQQWVILAPERLLEPDETAVEVLKLVDGARTVGEVIDALMGMITIDPPPREVVATDVVAMLQDLADKAFLVDAAKAAPAAARSRA
jgi:pyrroloquinoline quinone biosynthesis protein D